MRTLCMPVLFSLCMGHPAIKQSGKGRKKIQSNYGKLSLSFLPIFHYVLENEVIHFKQYDSLMFLALQHSRMFWTFREQRYSSRSL